MSDTDTKRLSPMHLLRMELAQEQLTTSQLKIDLKNMENERDNARVQVEQVASTARTFELALVKNARDKEIDKLRTQYGKCGRSYDELKAELALVYDIADWSRVTYNDETGLIQFLPEPAKG